MHLVHDVASGLEKAAGPHLTLRGPNGQQFVEDHLWTLTFGNGKASDANTLYFTAGIPGSGNLEDHGLFGSLQVAPAPAAPAPPPSQPTTASVDINNFAFAPPALTVSAGTQIVWTNKDGTAHTITADDGRFNSDPFDKTQTFKQTLTTPGTYTYHCSIHPFMKGKIVVQ